ncbi:MAG: hypothetical protein QM764_14040 [Chitinophagaceae bacterium]
MKQLLKILSFLFLLFTNYVNAQNSPGMPSGNIGIGTGGTAPSRPLQVQKGIGATVIGGQDYGNFIGSNNDGYELNLQGGVPSSSFGNSGGALRLGGPARDDADKNVIQFLQNGAERMRIHNGGNVGIGTTNAFTKLIVATGASNDGIWLAGNKTDIAMLVGTTGGAWNSLTQAGDKLLFWKGSDIDKADAGGLVIGPWSNSYSGMRITPTGNIGIGTASPRVKLDVWGSDLNVTGTDFNGTAVVTSRTGIAYYGNNSYSNGLAVDPSGNVGIGTSKPDTRLSVAGDFRLKNENADGARMIWNGGTNGVYEYRVRVAPDGELGFFPKEGGVQTMSLGQIGNVGIGINPQDNYKLAVDGTIGAKKVKVSTSFSDYVFDKDYRLPTLEEVERYINANHHLPEMPTTCEVEKNGLDIGDNQVLLVKKIEELTLYMIELKKENKQLLSRLEKLERSPNN